MTKNKIKKQTVNINKCFNISRSISHKRYLHPFSI